MKGKWPSGRKPVSRVDYNKLQPFMFQGRRVPSPGKDQWRACSPSNDISSPAIALAMTVGGLASHT